MMRRLWQTLLAVRFRLFQRHRYRQLVLEHVDGFDFLVLPDVFNPGLFRTGAFLAAQLPGIVSADTTVLDMGTGSGIDAIFAAQLTTSVTAVDINPEAVRCATINTFLNCVEERVCVRQSDLFEAVSGKQFDVVLFNPPFFRGAPQTWEDYAWRSRDVVERFALQLPPHLTPDGCALVVLSTNGEQNAFLETFKSNGLHIEILARKDVVSEMLTVYKLRQTP